MFYGDEYLPVTNYAGVGIVKGEVDSWENYICRDFVIMSHGCILLHECIGDNCFCSCIAATHVHLLCIILILPFCNMDFA